MSLPPILLQRLKQRGLAIQQNATLPTEGIEEIIAENYDDDEKRRTSKNSTNKKVATDEHFWPDKIKERIGVTESYHGYKLCPNKYNVWHKCTLYCVNRWTNNRAAPTDKYMTRFKRLIRKFPIDAGWKEIYDAGCGCYFFYNSSSFKVSWLPPSHPRARISSSSAVFRRQLASSNDEYNCVTDDIVNKTTQSVSSNESYIGTESDFKSVSSLNQIRKQKSRDLERALQRKRRYDTSTSVKKI